MIQHDIDLCDELMTQGEDADIYTVANMDQLVAWVKTQFPESVDWEDIEMTGIPLGAFYSIVQTLEQSTLLRQAIEHALDPAWRRQHDKEWYDVLADALEDSNRG